MTKYCDDVDYNGVVLNTIHSWPFVRTAINLQVYTKGSLTELVSDSPELYAAGLDAVNVYREVCVRHRNT
jgi:hypothetical protein